MVYVDTNEIIQGEKTEPIKKWEVWFMIPFGLTPDFKQAVDACKKVDFDPQMNVVPVPVAISETMYEICGGFK